MSAQSNMKIKDLCVCGGGLAGWMTAAALARSLPRDIKITLLDTGPSVEDMLYGASTLPDTHGFHKNIHLTERDFVIAGNAAFSLGTEYKNFGPTPWFLGFDLALPVVGGVKFHHYMVRAGETDLGRYAASSYAAKAGVFTHPENNSRDPFGSLDYGYQISPTDYAELMQRVAQASGISIVAAQISDIHASDGHIQSVGVEDGTEINADLFIDCTGPSAKLMSSLGQKRSEQISLSAQMKTTPAQELGPAFRSVEATKTGWTSTTPVPGATIELSLGLPEDINTDEAHCSYSTGRLEQFWTGNCLAIGHAAGMIDPVTNAPIFLMQSYINKLISLFPASHNMSVERSEFNRLCLEDFDLMAMYTTALYQAQNFAESPFWQRQHSQPICDRLQRKIDQFESRGRMVAYDDEPFHERDWLALHFGLGRVPRRYDIVADKIAETHISEDMAKMAAQFQFAVEKRPTHAQYRNHLVQQHKR